MADLKGRALGINVVSSLGPLTGTVVQFEAVRSLAITRPRTQHGGGCG